MVASITVRSKMKRANALLDNGQAAEAKILYAQICALDRINAEAWLMLGIANKELGLADKAIAALEKASALRPQDALVQNEKGMLLAQAGRYREAIAAFRLALAGAPDPAAMHVNIGVAHGLMGQHDLALGAFDQALRDCPQSLAAYTQRSAMLAMLGRYEEALHAAEQALRINRHSLEANIRYSEALAGLERYGEALAAYGACLAIAPDHFPSQQKVVEICRQATVSPLSAAHFEILQHAYGWRHVNLQDLSRFAASVFKARAGFLERLETALVDDGQSVEAHLEALRELATAHRFYFEGMLAQSLLEDAQLELATTGFRARLLHFLWAHRDVFDAGIPAAIELLLCGLSRQCFNNEYLWGSTEVEERLLVQLGGETEERWQRFSAGVIDPALALRSWMVSLYRPLHAVIPEKQGSAIAGVAASPLLKQVLTIQYAEYWEEQQIKAKIRPLTSVAEGVSAEVRLQYEENPYPRWQSLPSMESGSHGESGSAGLSLSGLFAGGNIPRYLEQPMEILIAGCGTGRHSIQTARNFQSSRVTAIDLSLTSLAYAARKTAGLRVGNVEYFQADIMALGKLDKLGKPDKQFHIVESIGVLHHLESPLSGWRTLASLLVPGGLMHIALYSKIARSKLDFARDYIKQAGLGSDAASIREFRKRALLAPEGSALAEAAHLGRDFYSLSNCRDLLFHVQEHQFTLLQIASLLKELGLDFLAMEADPRAIEAYAHFNPADPQRTDLESWHRFELENPLTFAGMYQFWCQKR